MLIATILGVSNFALFSLKSTGLAGMESGIDDFMSARFEKDGRDWIAYRKAMKKAKRWEVETY